MRADGIWGYGGVGELASLMGDDGRAVMCHKLDSTSASCEELRAIFSLEPTPGGECEQMADFVRQASQRAA